MTTENPMRMVESGGARKWASSKDAATFASVLNNTAADELGLLLKEQRFHGGQRDTVPNRSGSAPPSMEGSLAAFGNLMAQQSSSLSPILANLNSAIENCESEEQLRSDPAYFAYYCSNVNLNPRLPPPIISRENRHLARHIGGFGNNWRLTSYDDSGSGSLLLSTHNEEPEDDGSSRQFCNDLAETGSEIMSAQIVASLAGRHKSLVDLIQEDFPRTPSPVYNQPQSSSHATTAEESTDHEVQAISLDDLSINTSKMSESKSGSSDVIVDRHAQGGNVCGLKFNDDPSVSSFPEESYSDVPKNSPPKQKHVVNKDDLISGVDSSRTGAPKIYSLLDAEDSRNKQPHLRPQRGINYAVHGGQAHAISQGVTYSHNEMEKVSHGYPKFSSVEVQPVLHPPGPAPPLYASNASYINPFYPNLHSSGLYPSQYSLGGYTLGSSFLPPYGYPSPMSIPTHFDPNSGQSFNGQAAISTGESISHAGDLQHNKFYGHGLMMQPSFVDPLHMHYFQRQVEGNYGASGHYGQASPTGVIGSEKETAVPTLMGDQKFQFPGIPSPRMGMGGITGNYYRSPPSMGVMPQYPASPLGSPTLPGSPVAGINPFGRRNEMKFHQGSVRSVGVSGWQGQRGGDGFNDPRKHSFLEELKSNSARKIDLSEIAGRIVEFSVDQHGSRFIQQKLENCSVEEKASVFEEVLPHASKLMTDVFGNYVIQKFFEHGSHDQRKELANQLSGEILPLSLQMYGCRVIQKALEVIDLDQKTQLVHELDGNIMRCVRDQNGNHVIQKCIECLPTEKIGFIIFAFRGQVATLSTHPYGCRVIQRVLEHCSDESQGQCIVDEILESALLLAQDQYGNYVTQHVLERGKPQERSQIISKLSGKVVQMSQHKYASNVVEKCLEYGDAAERELMIEEILGKSEENDNLLGMMKDQFANYVVQKILEISGDDQREILLNRIRVHLQALRKYTYGKHIVARFEQLVGEDSEASELQGA